MTHLSVRRFIVLLRLPADLSTIQTVSIPSEGVSSSEENMRESILLDGRDLESLEPRESERGCTWGTKERAEKSVEGSRRSDMDTKTD